MSKGKAQKFSEEIFRFLDLRDYKTASIKIKEKLELFNASPRKDFKMLGSIVGSFIDLGGESLTKMYVKKGLGLLYFHREKLTKAITDAHVNYIEGNGYSALYSIKIANSPYRLPKPQDVKETYFQAKCAYLRAFKTLDLSNLDEFSLMVLTNLANNLNMTGRFVESLQYYDMVLKKKEHFVNALHGKGEALIFMIRYTKFQKTPSLYSSIYSLFSECKQKEIFPPYIQESLEFNLEASRNQLVKLNYSEADMKREYEISTGEYEKHSNKIKFFIDNFLTLSEHSLYCRCNVSKDDDLTIGFHNQLTTDIKLLKLESYLNRMKSEFSLARNLFYDYNILSDSENITYMDFKNDIINGVNLEKLRTSFRLCFGILDKIAHGICALLEIPKISDGEFIYFHSFWFKNNENRQNILNSKNNAHLTALYCIASDLFYEKGELAFYKEWRNELEHGSLLIRNSNNDPYNILDEKLFPISINPKDFEDKTKQVLQLTRAAIFSYAYCVREELFTRETFNK
ncbi:MAG: LA2681 family HEPN domain-containing protein [Bacteroidia bacterium]